MKHSALAILALASIVMFAATAQAAVTTVALYHCGEDGDNPAVSLIAAAGTDAALVHSSGGTRTIETGTTGAMGSTKYLKTYRSDWSPGIAYLSGQSTNWGMSAWVLMPSAPLDGSSRDGDSYWMMSNGGWSSGVGLDCVVANVTTKWNIGGSTVDPSLWGTWAHVASVYQSGQRQLYVNGELIGTTAGNAGWTTGIYNNFWVGTYNANDYISRGAEGFDEIQVFSFNAGEFDISDVYQTIPEPATMSLLVIGGVAALIRRRRS
ncbi:MAG: PEP-CTERM sorting domain-containing protein [Planctomycetaceae bacterium]|nr:PEP-CTERM sorting domain-containing protein [Planctomycetaceae bacterium]